ncbi:NAD(P)H-hydrate dehydratase [Sabulicella glaciei]|uniref:Bifunctional NAD(P)H-hydrate repair enzyme n=1 Tax=Sabulicella glaciei TaxID=2984948 RepID=A0ABT3NRT3_9PROT|nr:NAD(P)H-hydrate dehydratase [Roseococcus sp. MDT2-1-1]MCW8084870.1 NAD(P)H-hydrate dehydratase [Roseococcus sp. MDT2-1-1]
MSAMTRRAATPSELLSPTEMAEADRLAGNGPALMEAAGAAVARAIRSRFRPLPVLVLAGPGHNGGDGYVAARHLERAGWDVAVAPLAPPNGDAAGAAAHWRGPIRPFAPASLARAGLVVDAVFGAGLSRPVDGQVAETLCAIRTPIVAVDVPSGVDGATGAVRGLARQAALTVTFFRLKPGHLLLPGRDLCGETVLAEIGLPEAVLDRIGPRSFRNGPGLWRLPQPDTATHKHSRGHVTMLSSDALSGAALLAARGARRAGAGLVTLACESENAARAHRMAEPGALTLTGDWPEALLEDGRREVFCAGPGLPPDATTRGTVAALLAAGKRLVLDAGALTAFAGHPDRLHGAAILTPHMAEFARLFGEVGKDRLEAARRAAAQSGAVILLKGSDTVIAAPDGRAAINDNAPAWLATGGTGDVLAGIAAALLAQGMPPFEAACAAAWLQGEAAQRAGPGMIAEDLPPQIHATFLHVAALI